MWDKDEILQNLYNDYITHRWRKEDFERNDNDVDRQDEVAICDYILEKIATYEGKTIDEVYKKVDDIIQGVFVFDPQSSLKELVIKEGLDYYAAEDICYADYDTFTSMFEKEELDYLFEEIFSVNKDFEYVYIPKGTKMTYKEYDEKSRACVFIIHGEEFAFSGPAFKLKPAK